MSTWLKRGAMALGFLSTCGLAHAQNPLATVSVDVSKNRRAINPNIYGVSFATREQLAALNCPLNRWGGNAASRHNWQQNASNRAGDYFFESISDEGTAPGAAVDSFVADARATGAQPMITIPNIGWIAKLGANRDKLASFSVAKYGAQTQTDPWMPDAGNGIRTNGTKITGNDPNDANTPNSPALQTAWVNHLKTKWGAANAGGVRYYVMDNETSLWHETHRDVHPAGQTMEESRDGIIKYSAAVRAADPNAVIVGPEEWGWSGYLLSGADQKWSNENGVYWNQPDKVAHGGADYLPWLLGQLKAHDAATGKRSLDVFTVHYYPQGGEFNNYDTSAAMQQRRNRSTRSLWDPNYTDETWINDKVRLVPRLKQWVNENYPGLQTGITEYSWGAENHINGATAQADILGIFGREGLDMANRWTTPTTGSFAFKAMQMYRNYDGNKSTFGNVSVQTVSDANADNLAVFASQRTADGALTLMAVSKTLSGDTPLKVNVAGISSNTAQVWRLSSAGNITRGADVAVTANVLQTTLPPQSITLFVFSNAAGSKPPTVQFSTPKSGTALRSLASVSGTATDDVRVARVALYIKRNSDGKQWNGTSWVATAQNSTVLGGTATNATWSKTSGLPSGTNLTDGAYTLTAWAIDSADNRVSATSNIVIDTKVPLVAITSPRSGITLSSLASLAGTTSDERSGIARVALYFRRLSDNFYWTGSAWTASSATFNATLGSGTWSSASVPPNMNFPNGEYLLTAYAYDRAGNKGRADSRFTVSRAGQEATASPVQLSAVRATTESRIFLTFTGSIANANAEDFRLDIEDEAVEIHSVQQAKASEIVLSCDALPVGTRLTVAYALQDTQSRTVTGEATTFVK